VKILVKKKVGLQGNFGDGASILSFDTAGRELLKYIDEAGGNFMFFFLKFV
jgi:hypothetical protein